MKKNRVSFLIKLIFLFGIFFRLIIILFQTHVYDSLNIIALFKSVADTGNIAEGFFALKQKGVGEIQLYGKIFYQIGALWLKFLEKLKVLEIKYLFDTKPYSSVSSYLEGFLQWGVLYYQLMSIKFFQLIFDFLVLIFLVKIFKLLNYSSKFLLTIFLFWAFYPLIPYTSYVLLQSDLLLVFTILASLFFLLEYSLKNKFLDLFLSIIFISLGAVIKQVSILFFPFVLITFSKNFFLFLKITVIFVVSYFLFSQAWSLDIFLIKRFLINSIESLRLFNFNLNGIPIFLIGYFFVIFLIFIKRNQIRKKPEMILIFYGLILCLVYLTYDINGLFVQFNLWIAPILLLLTLKYWIISPFLTLPMIGFLKRALEDNDVILGSFGAAFGSSLHHTIHYRYFIQQIIHPEVFMFFIKSLFIGGYLILIYYLFKLVKGKKIPNDVFIKSLPSFVFNPNVIIVLVFLFYNLFVFVDIYFRKSTSLLTKYNYEEIGEEILGKKPLLLEVSNKNLLFIEGIELKIPRVSIDYNDPLVVEVLDKNYKVVDKVSFSLYDVGNIHDNLTFIKFKKPIKEKEFLVRIYNTNPKNKILISKTKIKSIGDTGGHYAGYDNFFKKELIKIKFPENTFYANLRGNYSLSCMLSYFRDQLAQKPKFYFLYFSFLTFLCFLIIFLILKFLFFDFRKLLRC